MFQNFKADIIYYNTQTDFELEFNLCGCCRMRLLNDKCSDKKTLLMSLSRAFSRSRVIILTAPLFDGSNIIKTVSVAIGNGIEEVDCNAYGINSDAPIEITKGSTPLITADGIFGGCIIESGPQTLIILTDNKSIRKNIMKNLIHPYIEEIAKGNPAEETEPQDPNEIITEIEEMPTEAEPLEDDLNDMLVTGEETDAQAIEESEAEYPDQTELIMETEEEPETNEDEHYYTEGNDLYTEIQNRGIPSTAAADGNGYDDDYGYYDEDYYIEEPPAEKNSAFNISLIIISAILLLAIAVLCFCIFFVPAQSGTTPAAYLQEIFDVMFK